MNLKRQYTKNYIDPRWSEITQRAFHNNYGTIGRQFGEGFITGDAITAACIYLQVVAETAFTNTLFVAMPSRLRPTATTSCPPFLSVQSDESRHISNGFGTLLMLWATSGTISC